MKNIEHGGTPLPPSGTDGAHLARNRIGVAGIVFFAITVFWTCSIIPLFALYAVIIGGTMLD